MDVEKQVSYWRQTSRKDLVAAKQLISKGKVLYGLFMAHSALEKMLKADFCRFTERLAPRVHNLERLGQFCELQVPESMRGFLGEMDAFDADGEGSKLNEEDISREDSQQFLRRTEEFLNWLGEQF